MTHTHTHTRTHTHTHTYTHTHTRTRTHTLTGVKSAPDAWEKWPLKVLNPNYSFSSESKLDSRPGTFSERECKLFNKIYTQACACVYILSSKIMVMHKLQYDTLCKHIRRGIMYMYTFSHVYIQFLCTST